MSMETTDNPSALRSPILDAHPFFTQLTEWLIGKSASSFCNLKESNVAASKNVGRKLNVREGRTQDLVSIYVLTAGDFVRTQITLRLGASAARA